MNKVTVQAFLFGLLFLGFDFLPYLVRLFHELPIGIPYNIVFDIGQNSVIILLLYFLYLVCSPSKGVAIKVAPFVCVFIAIQFYCLYIFPDKRVFYVYRTIELIRYITIFVLFCLITIKISYQNYTGKAIVFYLTVFYFINNIYLIKYQFIDKNNIYLPSDIIWSFIVFIFFWILFKYHKWYRLIKLEAPVNDTDVFLLIRKPLTKKSFIQYLRIVFIPEGIAFSLYHNHKWTGFKKVEGISVFQDWTPSESNKKNNWFINCGHSPELLKVFNSRAGFKYKKGFLKFGKQNCIDVFLRPVMSCNSKINFLSFI